MNDDVILDIREQLENELTWRRDEIRLLHNQLTDIESEEDKKRFRKALIVMLYSHYEGFCSTAFEIYIQAINNTMLKRKQLNAHLAASSFSEEFTAYDNEQLKPGHYRTIFKNDLPDDRSLHRFARQIDLVKSMDEFWEKPVSIPDEVIQTDANLKPVVLKKVLYRLGMPHDYFKEEEGRINELVNRRNSIAHGAMKEGFDDRTYKQLENAVFRILTEMIQLVMKMITEKHYMTRS